MPEGHITGDADLGVFGTCSIFFTWSVYGVFPGRPFSESEQKKGKLQKFKLTGDQRISFVSSASISFIVLCPHSLTSFLVLAVVNFVSFELGFWSEGLMTSWESTPIAVSLIILAGEVYLPNPTLAEKL